MATNNSGTAAGDDDAVCFTSGPKGAAFGAGVIHAWLAADRKPPLVVAGISTGALTSAAMKKCFQEVESASPETRDQSGWTWFRRYLEMITVEPLDFLWKAIPDPVDFFSDKPPVTDTSVPEDLKKEEPAARRHYFLLTRLGVWMGGLPVRVKTVASALVHYVRVKEQYGFAPLNYGSLIWNLAKVVVGVWWHVLRAPMFFLELSFNRKFFRPFFGWRLWLGSTLPIWIVLGILFTGYKAESIWPPLSITALVFALAVSFLKLGLVNGLLKFAMARLDLSRGVIYQFQLRLRLYSLFGKDTLNPTLSKHSSRKMHAILVCAALQQRDQVWLGEAAGLEDALSAALAVPGVFPPILEPSSPDCVRTLDLKNYKPNSWPAQLIDGVAVRNNPIPAFFEWCRDEPEIASHLERDLATAKTPSLFVVYNVPTQPEEPLDQSPASERMNIVDSALISRELEKRRDTRQEVRQTNFTSYLEALRHKANPTVVDPVEEPESDKKPPRIFKIYADEIAPRQEIKFNNSWEPTREESLQVAARGCRETLETLYRDRLQHQLQNSLERQVHCASFLRVIAPGRSTQLNSMRQSPLADQLPGLPEVCQQCPRMLSYRPRVDDEQPAPGVMRTYGEPGDGTNVDLRTLFSHLNGDQPRIVFLGNGGVFRGAFHIGVIAAMKEVRLFPDLVLGASVGTLMGGALATLSVSHAYEEDKILGNLTGLFLNVGKRVGLTRTLKSASKQLGVRARNIEISPAEMRRMVIEGSRADAGFAATGAPPALTDAISTLFRIPHRMTAKIASDFVAGHITRAIHQFLQQLSKETLPSFDVEYFLMGVSLLEAEARRLLGGEKSKENPVNTTRVQPYHDPVPGKDKVSFFCTTSFLNGRAPLLLGRDFLTRNPTWDSISAGLGSSAFPMVFSPVTEAQILPGVGRTDRLFADGGILDNLPFFPAIEVLAAVQSAGREKDLPSVLERVKKRTEHQDIFIAAGLNASPEESGDFDTVFKIKSRAASLSVDSKVETFVASCKSTQKALKEIGCNSTGLGQEDSKFLDGAVSATIIHIVPCDKEHINPTFAFCSATGMNPGRVSLSIADGCFQSLAEFYEIYESEPTTRMAFNKRESRVQHLELRKSKVEDGTHCPYFTFHDGDLTCPFSKAGPGEGNPVGEIRNVCAGDPVHQRLVREIVPQFRSYSLRPDA